MLIVARYKIESWGHKLIDQENNIYRETLDLVRIDGQKPLAQLKHIPTPSQVDEWIMYLKIVGDDIRDRNGAEGYNEWRDEEKKRLKELCKWDTQVAREERLNWIPKRLGTRTDMKIENGTKWVDASKF